MPCRRQVPLPRPRRPPKLAIFGSALIATLAVAACSTEDLHPDVAFLSDPSFNSPMSLYVSRDDSYAEDLSPNYVAPYHVKVDGRYIAYNESQFVLAGSNGSVGLVVPTGEHVFSLVDDQGRTAVSSPTVETTSRLDTAQLGSSPAILFYGGPTTMRAQVFINDPVTVPAGSVRVRVMNAFADHEPLQVVQCPTTLDGSRLYAGDECTPVGPPTSYGNLYETDATPDLVAKLGFYWAAPGAVAPVVAPVSVGSQALNSDFVTRIPLRVAGPTSSCPTCLFTSF